MSVPVIQKGKSPFYPGQPVPVELFVGRKAEIERVTSRGAAQVAAGKPVSVFIQGEYGIGKSSIAGFLQAVAERQYNLHAIYAPLGGADTVDDVAARILEATLRSGAFEPTRSEKIRNWLSKYVGEQSLFGFSIHAEQLRKDAPSIAAGMLPFFAETYARLKDTGVTGLFVILDEINGITGNAKFAHFIKGVVDTNAMSRQPVPLLLVLCGVEERRREMISHHQPIDRIFDVVDINAMSVPEMQEFFTRAFSSVGMEVKPRALDLMCHYSAGFPKIMHVVGDMAYWHDTDGMVDEADASNAVFLAADEIGKKYVDQQVYRALRSADYRSILKKIALPGPNEMAFIKRQVEEGLTDTEKRKFNNFLQKMKALKVLRSGETRGEYVFNLRMVRLYIWLESRPATAARVK
jgi:Cdc6-like AAA superfamily ATPase